MREAIPGGQYLKRVDISDSIRGPPHLDRHLVIGDTGEAFEISAVLAIPESMAALRRQEVASRDLYLKRLGLFYDEGFEQLRTIAGLIEALIAPLRKPSIVNGSYERKSPFGDWEAVTVVASSVYALSACAQVLKSPDFVLPPDEPVTGTLEDRAMAVMYASVPPPWVGYLSINASAYKRCRKDRQ